MLHRRIPRWHQCGIFSIWLVWATLWLPQVRGQIPPDLILPKSKTTSLQLSGPSTANITILGLRVAFEPDVNLSTTGDGQFLMSPDSSRCDGFLVDPPPHDADYFHAQLEAVANYYERVTREQVTFDLMGSLVFPPQGHEPILLNRMATYRPVSEEDSTDILLVRLFEESVLAAVDSGLDVFDYDIAVVFHAGLGQDFTYPFLDPTPLDIPSAYIDLQMIQAALGTSGIPIPVGDDLYDLYDRPGIILPEGQNHIYYDIVEDIFPGGSDYCDVQIGLTGTFALLMGYALGLSPLFDTDDGEPGVGVFGLMDVGSNNGQGVIPAPPTAWTRLHQGWEQAVELVGNIELAARHLPAGQIGRVTLSKDEYLLIENRLNWVPGLPGVSMDSLRYRNGDPNEYGGLDLPHYFDYLVDSAGVTVDPATGVITSVPNYDLGLPGSGLLIWHVDQARYTPDMQGLNDDPEARAVALEEADGAVDIGFPTTALISDPIQGWYWDLWFAGNEAFFVANPDRRVSNPDRLLSLDYDTYPSSALNSGAESGIAIRGIGFAGETLSLSVGDESDVTRLPEGSRLTCFNGNDWIYRNLGGWWVLGDHQIGEGYSNQHVIISEHDAVSGQKSNAFWILETTQYGGVGYSARRFNADGSLIVELMDSVRFDEAYFIDGQLHIGMTDTSFGAPPDSELIAYYHAHSLPASVRSDNRWGYLWNTDEYSEVIQTRYSGYQYDSLTAVLWSSSDDVSLGDVDGDGLDEIVAISPGGAYQTSEIKEMIAVNADGMRLDGFPVTGQFESSVLLANLMDDIRPELIVVESGDIAIYNPEGEELERLGLHTGAYSLFLLHFPDGRVGLGNGDRIHWFEPEVQNLQWVTMEGRFSGNRYSLNTGVAEVSQPAVLDKSRVYNYPNPVLDGATTIRFYVGTAQKATISIYTIDGLLVEKVELTDLAINDYNEWVWEVGDQPSGLYYGAVEVEGAGSESALIKIAVVR